VSERVPRIDAVAALGRIRPFVLRTPLISSPVLSERVGREVLVKLENLQNTGSFKIRGAASRMTLLDPSERARGVVACSSGNHGRAVAHMARELGIEAVVCVPEWVDPVKLEAMRAAGARVELAGGTYDQADRVAHDLARKEGRVFIHPFDDEAVAAGQGTLGLEILEDRPDVAEIALALSGGGLAGGVAAAVRGPSDHPRVTAVTARAARVMWESLRAGRPLELEEEPTLAGALAGGIGLENRVTFDLVREIIHNHVLVEEDEIEKAIRFSYSDLRTVVEGGGAVALAAALEGRLNGNGPLAVVLSGGNLDLEVLRRVLSG
jgi:threonine dehydratase